MSGAGAFAPSSPLSVEPAIVADQLPRSRAHGRCTWPVARPSRWFPLSITAESRAVDFGCIRELACVVFVVRQVPETQPSPVVSFSTACVVITSLPASRASELVEVPRQTEFVTRNAFPSSLQVRVCIRVCVAVNAAETSEV